MTISAIRFGKLYMYETNSNRLEGRYKANIEGRRTRVVTLTEPSVIDDPRNLMNNPDVEKRSVFKRTLTSRLFTEFMERVLGRKIPGNISKKEIRQMVRKEYNRDRDSFMKKFATEFENLCYKCPEKEIVSLGGDFIEGEKYKGWNRFIKPPNFVVEISPFGISSEKYYDYFPDSEEATSH